MSYDEEKVDEMALALMYLSSVRENEGVRAWKTFAWEITDRLFEKGYIGDPKGQAKSVWMTDEGARLSEELFRKHFELGKPK
jgi:Domain of unknown function (DUF6429)